ncbi:MAG TPA: glucose-6-phosphate dehydrogenase [Streptosporangiaceae bacterium]|nr:glucose-6-phosphate dehydrogenase [Streptosporangiaceae bacterium]
MINRLAIFGATGDLTGRYLLPALASLRAGEEIDDGFQLVGAGREPWSSAEFRQWAAAQLDQHARELPPSVRAAIASQARYHEADVSEPSSVAAVIAGDSPVACYLALPPGVFLAAVAALHDAGLPEGSRIVLEKPFGVDLASAIELNRLLGDTLTEQEVFRVDHFLAMTTVQNLLGTRLANRVFEPIWNSTHIAKVEIVWEESLALEGRAGYYDGVGALRDMLQNHLLQLLCLTAMEPPISLGERDLRDRKVDVLRSVRPFTDRDIARATCRGQYTAGRIGDRDIPAYVDEDGVDPAHRTETYAEIELNLDNWRWPDTTFVLRTGKALSQNRKEVAVHFRPVPHLPFGHSGDEVPNLLRFGLDPENVGLELTGIGPRARTLSPMSLAAQIEPPQLPAYGQLLHAVLSGDTALAIRGDEAEESWRVVEPVLAAWSSDLVPLEGYPAGSAGPEPGRLPRRPAAGRVQAEDAMKVTGSIVIAALALLPVEQPGHGDWHVHHGRRTGAARRRAAGSDSFDGNVDFLGRSPRRGRGPRRQERALLGHHARWSLPRLGPLAVNLGGAGVRREDRATVHVCEPRYGNHGPHCVPVRRLRRPVAIDQGPRSSSCL